MKKYHADIGSWERGVVITIEAIDPPSAYRIASEILSEKIESDSGSLAGFSPNSYVVQIYEVAEDAKRAQLVYDYMNLFFGKYKFEF